jgi:hypothetical protein
MEDDMKIEGSLCYWNTRKLFGIIEVRTREGAGYRFEKYFLHQSQVIYQTVEQPEAGDIVLFTVRGERRPLEVGMLPSATEAEIFAKTEQALVWAAQKGSVAVQS